MSEEFSRKNENTRDPGHHISQEIAKPQPKSKTSLDRRPKGKETAKLGGSVRKSPRKLGH